MAGKAQKKLSDLLSDWVSVPACLDCWVGDIQQDSRKITRGALFIAAEGVSSHGQDYIDEALARGASAIVLTGERAQVYERSNVVFVELEEVRPLIGHIAHRFFGQVTAGMTVIGVTGTNGKSSVTHYIAELAETMGTSAAVIGTLGIGKPGALASTTHTTPEAVTTHRHLAQLYEQGIRLVAMEVSSHAMDQYRVAGVRFKVGVFTNLSRDHLDYHGTMEAYEEAKKQLLTLPGIKKVINLDDATGRRWALEMVGENTVTYSSTDERVARVQARNAMYRDQGIGFDLAYAGDAIPVNVSLVGEFNLSNVLAATACLLSLGHSLTSIAQAMTSLTAVPGRVERLQTNDTAHGRPSVVVDYAHTPDALSVVLQALRVHCRGTLWCVFGCGGDRDPGKRPLMGEIAESLADQVVITDDNPRTEDPQLIIADILKGLEQPENAAVIQPRDKAIEYAIRHAKPGDMVLLAGKGHEDYQEVNGVRLAFSDSKIARETLEQLIVKKGNEPRQAGGWV
ncbi:UDP-N-acetylmuramoyl-L-alanyl-D-glutamate--2,6-diaminopimelate ligase [Hahella sp. CCB-MM4]|uniref:UDP-N-acetylmuramoyl-L-alanyl-D-glutamate--2, 6-diaminopimelate ligase n=1 Tax=Hahella sp. (strain CCB-MM4) TaxID=1926491 RepID=UPI001FEDA534|nr:UDP-N-acetylmuramoyl-L-alanyl-D-glutamate--2,6-diaminopimelate ligase [Hahella sp. CCB-MM4]